jgi:osmotically-inducible protein OsmY
MLMNMRRALSGLAAAAISLSLCFVAPEGAEAVDFGKPFRKAGNYMSDSAITTAVKTQYLAQKGLDSLDLRVETKNGIVTVRGQVHSEAQQSLAIKIARETDGVQNVVNKISVMP